MPNTYTWEAVVDTRKAVQSIQQLPEATKRAFSSVRIDIIDQSTINGARNALRTVTNDFSNTQSQMTGAARDQSQQRVNVAQDEANRTSQLARAFGRVRIQEEQSITAAVQSEAEKRNRIQQSQSQSVRPSGLGNLQSAVLGGIAGYLTIQGAQQIGSYAAEIATLNTSVNRASKAFEIMAGSAGNAEKILRAVQSASGGTVDNLQAVAIANQAMSLGLAKTGSEFERLTRAARAVTFVSPVIHDVQSAITELALASANLSFRRLDQLGLSVDEVKTRMEQLKSANSGLDDSQAFLQASVDALNTKFGALLDTTEAQASGVEKLTTAWSNLRQAIAAGAIGDAINDQFSFASEQIDKLNAGITGATAQFQSLEKLNNLIATLNKPVSTGIGLIDQPGNAIFDSISDNTNRIADLERLKSLVEQANQLTSAGTPGVDQYIQKLNELVGQAVYAGGVTAEMSAEMAQLQAEIYNAASALDASTQAGQFYAQAVALAGAESLNTDEKTANLINHMVELTVQYNTGSVSSSEYTAAINTMGGQLVSLAMQAATAAGEVANLTYQTQAFYAAQNSKLYFGSGGTKGTRPMGPMTFAQAQSVATDTSINPFTLESQFKSQQAYQKGLDAEAKKTAAAAKKATSAGTKAFNQAASEMESMLNSIVKVSQVTQEDIDNAKLGIYKEKPDEYLRRLRDEVNNGKDYKDVSIEDAAAGLNKIGIDTVGKSKEAILKLFEEAFGNMSLFADESNLQFLNDAAVNEQIRLQELAKKGQENVFKHFGGVVESAVSAAMGGSGEASGANSASGAGGAGGAAAIPTISVDGTALDGKSLDITATITGLALADDVDEPKVTVSATITAYAEVEKATKPTPMVTGAISKYEQLASAPVPIVAVGATITVYGDRTDAEKPTPTVSAGITKFLESSTAEKPTPTVEARLSFSSTRVDFTADDAEIVRTRLEGQINPRIDLSDRFFLLPESATTISDALSGAIAPKIDMGEPGRLYMLPEDAETIRTALGTAIAPHVTPIIDAPTPQAIQAAQQALQTALANPVKGPPTLGSAATFSDGKDQFGGSPLAQSYINDLISSINSPENTAQLIGLGASVRQTIDSGFLLVADSSLGYEFIGMVNSQIMAEQNVSVLKGIGFSVYQIIIAGVRMAMNDKNNKVGQEIVDGIAAQVIETQTKAVKEDR